MYDDHLIILPFRDWIAEWRMCESGGADGKPFSDHIVTFIDTSLCNRIVAQKANNNYKYTKYYVRPYSFEIQCI